MGEFFDMKVGMEMGCVISPFLFILYIWKRDQRSECKDDMEWNELEG